MSRKSKRNRPDPQSAMPAESRTSRRALVVGAIAAIAVAVVAAGLLLKQEPAAAPGTMDAARRDALTSSHSPTLGDANAKVHVVEFLDPACETCAVFYPRVKQLLAGNPGRIRLSLRHVPFHEGSEYVVRLLEASRGQDKYVQTLETLLATQARWAPHHTVQPELAMQAVAGVGLDMAKLHADMNSPEVAQRMQRDMADAATLKVTATPEYFVNGRPLPSFGEQQLLDLVNEELQRAY